MAHLRPVPITHPGVLICIHHSAANDKTSDPETLKAEYQHRNEGYNFVIDDDFWKEHGAGNDRIFKAVQMLPDDVVSNGAYGANRSGPWYAWNICVDGNFENQEPTNDEMFALIQVIAAKAKKWGWRKRDVHRITYHQEIGHTYSPVRYGTACPGKNMISKVPYIRERVKGYLPE